MKIIYRYIFKELLYLFFFGLIIFTFILLLERISYLIDLSFRQGVSFIITLKLLIFILPTFLIITIPISLLVASVVGFSRLSTDGEIVALKASGFSLYRLLIPGALLSLGIAVVNTFLILYAQPWGNQAFKEALFQLMESQVNFNLKGGVFNDISGNLVIYVKEIPVGSSHWKKVVISDIRDKSSSQIIIGEEGFLATGPHTPSPILTLKNGAIHKSFKDKSKYELLNFATYQLSLGTYNDSFTQADKTNKKRSKEMTFAEIKERLQRWKESKPKDLREKQYYYHILTEFHRKFSVPFSCFILGLLGIPLGIRNQRSGRSGGFAISIVVLTLYNMLSAMGEGLAEKGELHPLLGLWIPNLILTLVAFYLIFKVGQELPFSTLEKIVDQGKRWLSGEKWLAYWKKLSWRKPDKARDRFRGKSEVQKHTKPLFSWRGIKILNLYIIREYIKILSLGLAIFVSIYFLIELIGRIEDMAKHGADFYYLFLYFFYKFPAIIYQVLPFAVLLSSILTITLLARTNELTAIKSCGISLYRLSLPLIMLGLLLSGLSFLGNEILLPYTNQQAEEILRVKIKKRIPKGVFKNTKIWYRGEDNTIWHIKLLSPAGKLMRGVTLLRFDKDDQLKERVDAERVEWKNGRFIFSEGYTREFHADGSLYTIPFAQREVYSTEQIDDFRIVQKTPDQMGFRELYAFIKKLRTNGFDATEYTVDLYGKLSLSLACLIMVMLGIPFSLRSSRSGGLPLGTIFSIFLGFSYWLLSSIGISLGHTGQLPPLVAAWGTDALFLAAAVYLILSDRQ
jgi:LPS export ABC transporter permease LptG/LPS export ABC transporter permease LptF